MQVPGQGEGRVNGCSARIFGVRIMEVGIAGGSRRRWPRILSHAGRGPRPASALAAPAPQRDNTGSKAPMFWSGSNSRITSRLPARPCPPGFKPVTMLETSTRVTVGKTEWWLANITPPAANAERFGIRRGLTWAGWCPPNTKTNTDDIRLSLCRFRCAGFHL